ncbi:gluconokinase, GntK/IdnK-type [Sulfurimonas sp.]|nr:gluconokinase, GntK/IdnK-type [Sulfurimonas sp.]
MGVSGCGKTTIGKKMSEIVNYPFYDADSFHSIDNINKMKQGIELDDSDRLAWLKMLSEKIDLWNKNGNSFLACSALKEKYRKVLSNGYIKDVSFMYLTIDKTSAKSRILKRENHFFPVELIDSQYKILEVNDNLINIDANQSINNICKKILELLE